MTALPMDFDSLATTCAPQVAPSTLRAMASVESGINPFAVGVVGTRLLRQPTTLAEAVSTANALNDAGMHFSAGLVQIYVGNWQAHRLDARSVFESCTNLHVASQILSDCYVRASSVGASSQAALRRALSCYYSNNFVTGFQHGYVQRVVDAANRLAPPGAKTAPRGDSSTKGVTE